jgi:hypothetical protein
MEGLGIELASERDDLVGRNIDPAYSITSPGGKSSK